MKRPAFKKAKRPKQVPTLVGLSCALHALDRAHGGEGYSVASTNGERVNVKCILLVGIVQGVKRSAFKKEQVHIVVQLLLNRLQSLLHGKRLERRHLHVGNATVLQLRRRWLHRLLYQVTWRYWWRDLRRHKCRFLPGDGARALTIGHVVSHAVLVLPFRTVKVGFLAGKQWPTDLGTLDLATNHATHEGTLSTNKIVVKVGSLVLAVRESCESV